MRKNVRKKPFDVMRKVRIRFEDPDATDSSSDEGDRNKTTPRIRCFTKEILPISMTKTRISYGCCDDHKRTCGSSTLPKGVRQRPSGRFVAEIRNPFSRLREWLGTYDTIEEAAAMYREKEEEFKRLVASAKSKKLVGQGTDDSPFRMTEMSTEIETVLKENIGMIDSNPSKITNDRETIPGKSNCLVRVPSPSSVLDVSAKLSDKKLVPEDHIDEVKAEENNELRSMPMPNLSALNLSIKPLDKTQTVTTEQSNELQPLPIPSLSVIEEVLADNYCSHIGDIGSILDDSLDLPSSDDVLGVGLPDLRELELYCDDWYPF